MMNKVLFLGAFTMRSQAYLQFLCKHDLFPGHIAFFGDPNGKLPGQTDQKIESPDIEGMFIPDWSETLHETVEKHKLDQSLIETTNINDQKIYSYLQDSDYDLVIYSGYGGQIVGKKLLDLGIPFLHVHTGWLPEYRGSTTFFYSIINENKVGVSALFLNERIDEGKIIDREWFPPPAGAEADYSYDSIIRGEILVRVLKSKIQTGKYPMEIVQGEEGTTYYVIHPVMKHLALMKR